MSERVGAAASGPGRSSSGEAHDERHGKTAHEAPHERANGGTTGLPRTVFGCGSAFADDRLEPAAELADSGAVGYLGFDCLAERTLALAQVRRRADPQAGQDLRIRALTPLLAGFLGRGGRVVGNFGAANPTAAGRDFVDALRGLGLGGVRVGVIHGDDVRRQVLDADLPLPELGTTVGAVAARIVSANAYIGAEPIVECLEADARITLGGRLADPSLFVGPICHERGWALDDWDKVGAATLVGHMLECGVHSTGGNFEDPPYRVVPDPHRLAFPYASVEADGSAVVTKLAGSGGAVDERTAKTQIYYEIGDPAAYLTPDVTADFSAVAIEEVGPDRVRLSGARGTARPATLKVLVGVDLGWKGVGEASYGGPGCVERARRAEEILRLRLEKWLSDIDDLRVDLVGVDSVLGGRMPGGYPSEVRLRLAVRSTSEECVRAVVHEVDYLWFGPSGGGGVATSVVPALAVTPAFLPRSAVSLSTEVVVS